MSVSKDAFDVRLSEQRKQIIAAIREAGRPLAPKEILEVSGLGHDVVRQLFGKMVEAGDLVGTGSARAGRYSIPPPHSIGSIHTREEEEERRVSGMNDVKGIEG
jgi:hypothetical protein